MNCKLLAAVLVTILASTSLCKADDVDNSKWLKHIAGKWQAPSGDINVKIITSFRPVAGGKALLHEREASDGIEVIGIIAFEGDTMVHTSYGSDGNYQRIEYTDFKDDSFSGTASGVEDGKAFKGRKIHVVRIDENSFRITTKDADSTEFSGVAKRVQ